MRQALITALAAAAALAARAAHAHAGHGMDAASHWHAGDTVGLLVVGLLASAACWFTREK
jgi:hypothetical protein